MFIRTNIEILFFIQLLAIEEKDHILKFVVRVIAFSLFIEQQVTLLCDDFWGYFSRNITIGGDGVKATLPVSDYNAYQ